MPSIIVIRGSLDGRRFHAGEEFLECLRLCQERNRVQGFMDVYETLIRLEEEGLDREYRRWGLHATSEGAVMSLANQGVCVAIGLHAERRAAHGLEWCLLATAFCPSRQSHPPNAFNAEAYRRLVDGTTESWLI